jgi:hypothetical protein
VALLEKRVALAQSWGPMAIYRPTKQPEWVYM